MNSFLMEIIYLFYNYVVANIPVWYVRRMFYVLGGMKIGKGSRILMKTIVVKPWKIKLGNRVIINEYCYLDGRGGLIIGDDSSISIYSIILTGSHITSSISFEYFALPTIIENNVWVGARSILLGGAVLKHACVIAAGSTVKKGTYNENTIYSGIPAKVVAKRNLNQDYQLDSWKPWFR